MTTPTDSARRVAATHGIGLPHLWRWPAVGWACTSVDTAVAPTAAQAWETLTGWTAKPPRQRRRCDWHLTRIAGRWGCECDLGGGLVVRVAGEDPCGAIRSCRAIQRAGL